MDVLRERWADDADPQWLEDRIDDVWEALSSAMRTDRVVQAAFAWYFALVRLNTGPGGYHPEEQDLFNVLRTMSGAYHPGGRMPS